MPKGNNTIFFIPRGKFPKGKTVTYGRIVAEIKPHKTENHCVCITMVGDILDFGGVTATQCAGLVTTKMLFNITVSTPGDRFCTFDIRYFYYGSPMRDYGYRKIQLASIQQDIIDQYDLEKYNRKVGSILKSIK